jgi:hypothetical protein
VFNSFGKGTDSQEKAKKRIELKVNLKEQRELQNAVDNGHQPWRLDPIFVAQVEVVTNVGQPLKYEDCRIKSEKSTEAEVMCKGIKNYTVRLKRLIRLTPDGIWTAISIEVNKQKNGRI